MRLDGDLHEKLWLAVNHYAEACDGDTSANNTCYMRMRAVVEVERAVTEIRTRDRAKRVWLGRLVQWWVCCRWSRSWRETPDGERCLKCGTVRQG
jgi:hypothetical protein